MLIADVKPIIAIDIDDVLFPFVVGIAEHINAVRGMSLVPADFISFTFQDVWGGTVEESNQIVHGFLSKNCMHLLPIVGAWGALNRLKQDYTIILVTARNGVYEPETSRWLQGYFVGLFDSLVFAGNTHDGRAYRTKGEVCKELGAVLLIDDHPKNILSVTEQGLDGILFGTKAWSVMDILPAAQVTHCADWTQVERYIYDEWQPKQFSK